MIKDLSGGDPATVGPYRLLGRLGAGGMGQVYLAKSPGGRLVAIKLIRPELAEERGFRARFASEISAAKNVSGIYTAAVVDADADAELPWMATVYVPGPSLTDAVEDNGPLPVNSVLALAAGLAEALQAIHRAGLVHRDLKPSNVLLAADGPRVIDFGISLALERSMMTATGMVMGSPGFMSPEQARGQREVGAPSDVFSLGAVLAFAATGNGPFGGGHVSALLYRVVNETPDLAGVPAPLTALIGQCLAKDPAARPTPAELLERVGGDVGVLAGEWLPRPITEAMSRYTPTMQTAVPPTLGTAGPIAGGPIAAGDATAVDNGPLPATAVVALPGAVTAGRDIPGGPIPGGPIPGRTGGGRPPSGPPRRRWPWLAAAAAAAIVIAVVAVLLTAHSPGTAGKSGATTSTSPAGHQTTAPTQAATTASPTPTVTSAPTQPVASTPVTQPSPTASATTSAPSATATAATSQAATQQATTGSAPSTAGAGTAAASTAPASNAASAVSPG